MDRRLRNFTLLAMAVQLLIAALNPLVAVAITGNSKWLFDTPVTVSTREIYSDLRIYFGYADLLFAGKAPYRDYTIEYPLLAFPFLAAPRLFARSPLSYAVVFTIELWIVGAIATFLLARTAEPRIGVQQARDRICWYTLFIFCLGPIVFARYDLVPMTLALAAALAWFSGRSISGGALAGAGALVKIFPGLIAAPALVFDLTHNRSRWWRGMAAMAVVVGLGAALWFGLAGDGVRQSIRYHLDRGLEAGSVYAGLLILAAGVSGAENGFRFDHGSFQHVSPWSDSVAKFSVWVQVAALVLLMWRFRRSGAGDYNRYCGAALLAFIVTGKVWSPQYLLWVLPFMVLLERGLWMKTRWLFLGSCVLTVAVYPWSFGALLALKPLGVAVLNLRNLLLLCLLGLLLFSKDRRAVGGSA